MFHIQVTEPGASESYHIPRLRASNQPGQLLAVWGCLRGCPRWDRATKLASGALTPEWATFPDNVEEGETSFLCELDRDEQEGQIINYLENFDASLILFLKRIHRVDIEVRREDSQGLAKSIIRKDLENVDSYISILQDGNEESSYLKSTSTALNLPQEPKRHGSSASVLILAFPLQQDPNMVPPTSRQNVSSGLPVGDYGLKVSKPISATARDFTRPEFQP